MVFSLFPFFPLLRILYRKRKNSRGRLFCIMYKLSGYKFNLEFVLWVRRERTLFLLCVYAMPYTARVCIIWYSSYLLLAGRTDHVFCTHSMWMGHGCHFCHTNLPLGSGGLCWRAFLQGSQTDYEEGAVWSETAGDCLNARYKKWVFKSPSLPSSHAPTKKIDLPVLH